MGIKTLTDSASLPHFELKCVWKMQFFISESQNIPRENLQIMEELSDCSMAGGQMVSSQLIKIKKFSHQFYNQREPSVK